MCLSEPPLAPTALTGPTHVFRKRQLDARTVLQPSQAYIPYRVMCARVSRVHLHPQLALRRSDRCTFPAATTTGKRQYSCSCRVQACTSRTHAMAPFNIVSRLARASPCASLPGINILQAETGNPCPSTDLNIPCNVVYPNLSVSSTSADVSPHIK
nr:hypothetical protein CFP56_21009 [Quercus suber]